MLSRRDRGSVTGSDGRIREARVLTGSFLVRRRLVSVTGRIRARVWAVTRMGVHAGPKARVGRSCRLILEPGARLVLGDGSEVDDGTTLAVYEGASLVLGPGCFVGHHCTLASRLSVVLGEGAFLAEMVSVRDHDHAVGSRPSSGRVVVDPVEIGAHAWVGAKVTILRGATIGEGAVVGANAVVRGTIPPATVAVGVPARVIGPTDRDRS